MCMTCAGEIYISILSLSLRRVMILLDALGKVGVYSAQYNWGSYIYNSLERPRNEYNVKMTQSYFT